MAHLVTVIEHCDVFKHCGLGVCGRVTVLQVDQLGLKGVQATLRDSVVPTMPLPTHTGLYRMLGQELPITGGPILAATVRMHAQLRRRLPLAERH